MHRSAPVVGPSLVCPEPSLGVMFGLVRRNICFGTRRPDASDGTCREQT